MESVQHNPQSEIKHPQEQIEDYRTNPGRQIHEAYANMQMQTNPENVEKIKTENDFKSEIEDTPEYDQMNNSYEGVENIPGFTCENVDDEDEVKETPDSEMNKSFENEDLDTTGENGPEGQDKLKKHKCDHCEKAFARSEHLKRHVSCVHEGQRNYNCSFCEKAFSRQDRLKHHIKVVHEGHKNDVECELCGKCYYDKSTLKKHIMAVHEGEMYPENQNQIGYEPHSNEDSFANESDSFFHTGKSL